MLLAPSDLGLKIWEAVSDSPICTAAVSPSKETCLTSLGNWDFSYAQQLPWLPCFLWMLLILKLLPIQRLQ